ncbi:hypothetical protein TB2_007612 [Malus domestica]
MGPRRSTRLNVTISGAAPAPRVSTTGTTAVPSPRPKPCHPRRLMALRPRPKPHSYMHHAPSNPLSYPLAPTKQPAPVKQPASVVSQAAQVSPRPSRPIIKPGAFSPHFSTDLTFSNSNLVPEAYHSSITQGGTFHPSSSNLNGEKNLSR